MTRTEGSSPPRACEPVKAGDGRGWAQATEREGAWGIVGVFPHIQQLQALKTTGMAYRACAWAMKRGAHVGARQVQATTMY